MARRRTLLDQGSPSFSFGNPKLGRLSEAASLPPCSDATDLRGQNKSILLAIVQKQCNGVYQIALGRNAMGAGRTFRVYGLANSDENGSDRQLLLEMRLCPGAQIQILASLHNAQRW